MTNLFFIRKYDKKIRVYPSKYNFYCVFIDVLNMLRFTTRGKQVRVSSCKITKKIL